MAAYETSLRKVFKNNNESADLVKLFALLLPDHGFAIFVLQHALLLWI